MNEETKEKVRQKAKERWANKEWREKELKNRKESIDDYKARAEKISKTCREKNKGKWCIASGGYVVLLGGSNGGVLAHRKMMEDKLGRKLLPNEIVHHKDGDKLHNEHENFKLTTRQKHIKEEHGYSQERNSKISMSKTYPEFHIDIYHLALKCYSGYRIAKLVGCSERAVRKYLKLLWPVDMRGV